MKGTFLIEDVRRLAGDLCQFTNKFTVEKLLKDAGFKDITFYENSVSVVGDDIPRYVIHAAKSGDTGKKTESSLRELEKSNASLSKKAASKKEISFYDVENLLLSLYNKSPFYRGLFNFGYKILKKTARK